MSVTDIPAELMTPEQRAERITELQRSISRQWLRFAITEAIVIFAPFLTLLLGYTAGAVGYDTVVVGAVVASIAAAVLVMYWLLRRVVPLSRELAALEAQE